MKLFLYLSLIVLYLCSSFTAIKHFSFSKNKNFQTNPKTISASLYFDKDSNSFLFKKEIYDQDSVAFAKYSPQIESNGWDFLILSSYTKDTEKYSDYQKAYAMGYLEGILTKERIWTHFQNMRNYLFYPDGLMPENVKSYLEGTNEYLKKISLENYAKNDPYWTAAYTINAQFEGLVDGYNSSVKKVRTLSMVDFHVMASFGDIEDIGFYKNINKVDYKKMSTQDIIDYIHLRSHCSVLFKVLPDFSDVIFGHNSWFWYSSMTRIKKEYRIKTNRGGEQSNSIVFSGYPGTLASIDDFYITDQDLVVIETTNQIFNNDLYKFLNPNSLLSWVRTIIANRLASDGHNWTRIFSRENSGTYNNQFMVLDLKLIDTENRNIYDNALWIIEQVPGYTESGDVTQILRYGYWPSYNSAFFKRIRQFSFYEEQLKDHPELVDIIDYNSCSRAKIIRRDHSKINNIDDFKVFIRYNHYQNDPFSKKNPAYSISARKDFDEKRPLCVGGMDAKVASVNSIKGKRNKKVNIISGPTYDSQDAFDTETSKCRVDPRFSFIGLPKIWNFGWIEYTTSLFQDDDLMKASDY